MQRIFDHVENGAVDKAVRAALRLSRRIGDHMGTAMFLRELYANSTEFAQVIYDDTSHLKDEARKYLREQSLERWLRMRTMPDLPFVMNSGSGDDKRNVFVVSAADLDADIEQCERSIADMTIPPSMGEFDTAAFTDRFLSSKGLLRQRIRTLQTTKTIVLDHCQNFAIKVERQLAAQVKTMSFLAEAQNQVQNYFKARSADVYDKLLKANQLLDSTSNEDQALLLTEVRRAIKAVADHFYAPRPGIHRCQDGVERKLGEEQYANRLYEFVHSEFKRSTSTELLRVETKHLLAFAERLNDLASKGVHADVTASEAKQGLLGLYMFLFNLCQRLEVKDDGSNNA
ncbi:hypothetical protein LJR260_004674 [Variovorax paradoxus]|uniref:hypothetical protein n=1 Tax=Variovorax paradoxus TaxID=34073 RepID=UPI003ED1411C